MKMIGPEGPPRDPRLFLWLMTIFLIITTTFTFTLLTLQYYPPPTALEQQHKCPYMYRIFFKFKILEEKALLYQTWIKWAVSKRTSTYMHVEVALLYLLLFDLNSVKPLYITLLYMTESTDGQTPALLLLAGYLIRNHVLSLGFSPSILLLSSTRLATFITRSFIYSSTHLW